jgi:hypothetical protein
MHMYICDVSMFFVYVCMHVVDCTTESKTALFAQEGNGQLVRDILYPAFKKRSQEMTIGMKTFANISVMSHIWRSGSKWLRHPASTLPEIPEVAIQYRCSDNTQPGMGLLSWSAFLRHIPMNATSIFVMTENPHRRIKKTSSIFEKCNFIVEELSEYLYFHFPSASVVVLRGGSAVDDATRLAMAQVTICSASTFCLWPAIASKTASYFPRTKLIFYDKSSPRGYTRDFHWLTEPDEIIIPLLLAAKSPPNITMKMLKKGQVVVQKKQETTRADIEQH